MSDSESTSSSCSRGGDPLRVGELLEALQKLVAENPKAKSMRITFEEFGSLQNATGYTIENTLNGKKVKPYLVIE